MIFKLRMEADRKNRLSKHHYADLFDDDGQKLTTISIQIGSGNARPFKAAAWHVGAGDSTPMTERMPHGHD